MLQTVYLFIVWLYQVSSKLGLNEMCLNHKIQLGGRYLLTGDFFPISCRNDWFSFCISWIECRNESTTECDCSSSDLSWF